MRVSLLLFDENGALACSLTEQMSMYLLLLGEYATLACSLTEQITYNRHHWIVWCTCLFSHGTNERVAAVIGQRGQRLVL